MNHVVNNVNLKALLPVNIQSISLLWFSFGWEMHENWGSVNFHLKRVHALVHIIVMLKILY